MLVSMVLPLSSSTIGMLFGSTASSGGVDFSFLSANLSSGTATASIGSVKVALDSAEKNEAKQLAQVAKDPQVKSDLARYERVLKSAKSIDDVLNDPVARQVLMTATGLKSDVDNIGLAKKAMLSDPGDSNSLAKQMSSINANWLSFAKTYDLAQYGLDRLYPQQNGLQGRWRVSLEREGEPIEAMLEITKNGRNWQATIDGTAVPISVDGKNVTIDMLWQDDAEDLHTTRLLGTLGDAGFSGAQLDDGVELDNDWTAAPYFADALDEISQNYIAEKRLDMLDAQMPGLGSAVLFKQMASGLKDATDILGSPLGREIVTTAFNIPKQIAIQSLSAQEKAIKQRMDPAKLQNAHFVDQIAQRYLIMLNGGTGGITA
jgi:hypothetical protein